MRTELEEIGPVVFIKPNDDGRQKRLGIIVGIALAVVAISFMSQTLTGRQSDRQFEQLRADLDESFSGTTSDDFMQTYYDEITSQPSGQISTEIATEKGATPDFIQLEGNVLKARFGTQSFGGDRCIRATWNTEGVTFEEGSGKQCTASNL